jgi:ABC-type sulfate/molybdate transport systems ATPase subunit
VALARVMVQRRPLILLDEPFAALGPALKSEMLDLVAGLAAETGATLLMVSHDPTDARRIAPLTVLVSEGQASAPQATGPLLDNPPPALADYLGGGYIPKTRASSKEKPRTRRGFLSGIERTDQAFFSLRFTGIQIRLFVR